MPTALAAYFTSVGLSATAAAIVADIIIVAANVVLGRIAKALGPKQKPQASAPINVTVRDSAEYRRVLFGSVRAGGVIVFYDTSGANNDLLHYVVAYAGHQCNAIKDVYIDNLKILDANINAGTGAVTQSPLTGKLFIWKYLGTSSQAADADMVSSFPGDWTSASQLKGIAYIHVRMQRDDTAWPVGPPQSITAKVEGAKLYDPRLDSTNGGSGSHRYTDASTWAYSTNPALVLRWILTGGSVVNDATLIVKYGLRDLNSRMNDAYFIAMANKCDESLSGANTTPLGDQARYACNIEFSTGEPIREWVEAVLDTCAGVCPYVNGKWRPSAGAYDSPLHALTDADIFGDIEIQDTVGHEDRYNAVAAVFRDSTADFIEATTKWRTDSTYETQDNGERLTKELDLRGVNNDPRAQRLVEIDKRKSRLMRTVKIAGGLNLLKIAPWETFTLTNTKYGWSNRVFRCIERQFKFGEDAGRVEITARVESSSVWTDMVTADYDTPNTVTQITNTEIPEAPSGLTTSGIQNGIIIQWTRSSTPGVRYELEQSSSSTMSSPTVVYSGADNQASLYRSVTTAVYFRVRAFKAGQYSAYTPSSNGISGAATSVTPALDGSASPTSISTNGTTSSLTTGSVTVTPTGGTPAFTYAWTTLSGSGITINSTTAATTTFTATGLATAETRNIVARCTITDAAAVTKTIDVAVTIARDPAFPVTVNRTSISVTRTGAPFVTPSVTATPGGGTPAYTYLWTWVSGPTGGTITIDSSTSASTTCSATGLALDEVRYGVIKCTVTDSGSNAADSPEVSVSISRLS